MTIESLGIQPDGGAGDEAGRRVAGRPPRAHHRRGARHRRRRPPGACTSAARSVALAGLEPDTSSASPPPAAARPGGRCDVTDREQVEARGRGAVERLGGLDVVVANAGVAAQLPLVGGDPAIFERTLAVNMLGVYYTLRAAGAAHRPPRGYALPSPRWPRPCTCR